MTRREEIEHSGKSYCKDCVALKFPSCAENLKRSDIFAAYRAGAEWADSTAWKPADGDNLPEIDREVIALVEENGYYKVVYAHRPPEYWDGRNILSNEVTRNYTKRYDKGKWNQPNVKWWLDLELPKMEE